MNRMKTLLITVAATGLLVTAVVTAQDGHEGHDHDKHAEHEQEREHDEHEGHDEHEEGVVHLNAAKLRALKLSTATVRHGSLSLTLELPGEVRWNATRVAHVVPRVSGVVREVKVHLGDKVSAGQVMAVIDSRELADLRGSYLAAVERVDLAQATFAREEDLYKKKVSSGQSYLEAKQALAEAKIQLRSADQKLHALGYPHEEITGLPDVANETLTEYKITAPLAGSVIEKHITQGEALKGDADAFIVANLATVWVDLSIYQKDVARVKTGQVVRISGGPEGPTGEGKIFYLRPVIDEATRTTLARIVHSNADELWKPGLFVSADLVVEEISAGILVPKGAIQMYEGKAVVFVEKKDGFKPEPVKVGRANRTHVEILSGLPAGARFVAKGGFVLKAELAKGSLGDGHNH